MTKDIELVYKGKIHCIPNRWDGMTDRQYIHLVSDLLRMAAGKLSAGEVRINCSAILWVGISISFAPRNR